MVVEHLRHLRTEKVTFKPIAAPSLGSVSPTGARRRGFNPKKITLISNVGLLVTDSTRGKNFIEFEHISTDRNAKAWIYPVTNEMYSTLNI